MKTQRFDELRHIIARLRAPDGCPWDREQTLQTLKPFVIEEAYELLDAIDAGDPAKHCEELGDLLLQVVLQAQVQAEQQNFTMDDVVQGLCEKIVRRHPHVFSDTHAVDSATVLRNWAAIKTEEKKSAGRRERASVLGSIPRSLPSLQKAQQVQLRAARVGFDWTQIHEVMAKVDEEVEELKQALASGDEERVKNETGDLLFSIVNLSRFCRISAEEALETMITRFVKRFHAVEDEMQARGKALIDCSAAELNVAWESAKRDEVRTID